MVGLLLLYFGLAYVLGRSAHSVERDEKAVRNVAIYLISNGVHTNIAILKASGLPAVKWTPFTQPLIDHHRNNQK